MRVVIPHLLVFLLMLLPAEESDAQSFGLGRVGRVCAEHRLPGLENRWHLHLDPLLDFRLLCGYESIDLAQIAGPGRAIVYQSRRTAVE